MFINTKAQLHISVINIAPTPPTTNKLPTHVVIAY